MGTYPVIQLVCLPFGNTLEPTLFREIVSHCPWIAPLGNGFAGQGEAIHLGHRLYSFGDAMLLL